MRRLGWLGAAVLATAACGCNGFGPGDYVVYRVSLEQADLTSGCYWQYHGADANVRGDSSTVRTTVTFVLYAYADGEYLLDTGSGTLEGELSGPGRDGGDEYRFAGRSVDVQWEGTGPSANKRTTTARTTVDMTVDGALTFGELEIKTSYACAGQGCGELPPSCTATYGFTGAEVDVKLEHQIGAPAAPAPGTTPSLPSSGAGGSEGPGTGAAGGTGSCVSCGSLLSGEGSPANLCGGSVQPYSDLASCTCGYCAETCAGEALCSGESIGSPSPDCAECMQYECYEQASACLNDGES